MNQVTPPSLDPTAKRPVESQWTKFQMVLKTASDDWSSFGAKETFDANSVTRTQLNWVVSLLALAEGFDDEDVAEARAVFDSGTSKEVFWTGLVAHALAGPKAGPAVKIGDALRKAGLIEAERILMEKLTKSLPNFHWPWFALGRLERERGNAAKAVECLEKAQAAAPDFGWCHVEMHAALIELHRYEEAGAALERAVKSLPQLRKTMARERVQLLSRIRWSETHKDALRDVLELGPPSVGTSETLLDLFGQLLMADVRADDSIADCVSDVEHLFLEDQPELLDFNLVPVLFLSAVAIASQDPARAERLLAEFTRRLPSSLDPSVLPANFISVITAAETAYLRRMYVWPWAITSELQTVNELIAEFNLAHLHQPSIARMFCEAAAEVSGQDSAANATPLMIMALVAEMKWFEVLNLIRCRSIDDVANSSLLFSNFVSAVRAISDSSPALKLAALQQIMVLIDRAPDPAEKLYGCLDTMHGLIRGGMQQLYDNAKAAALRGDRREALAWWEGGLTQFCDMIERCEEILVSAPGTGWAPNPAGEVLVLTSPYLPQVLHYRGEQLAELIEAADIPVALIDLVQTPINSLQMRALKSRAVVIQRQPAPFEVMRFIAWCRQIGIPTYFDIDDQIFDARISPLPIEDYAGRIPHETHVHLQFDCAYFREAMVRCDSVIVSTEPLRRQVEAVQPSPKPIYLRRNMVGEPLRIARLETRAALPEPILDDAVEDEVEDKPVLIFYGSGTKAHKSYFDETVLPALIQVLQERPNAVVRLLGEFSTETLPVDVAKRFECITQMLDYSDYLLELAKADISIAPLNINPVTDGKSELKWFEAACVGVPSVVSPTANYVDVIEDGDCALFAESKDEWVAQLERLVDDADLREKLVARSMEEIAEHYEIADMAGPIMTKMGLLAPQSSVAKRRKRVLVINTFFWPESIGGATRIAENYAFDLAERYGEDYEVFALCANAHNRNAAPYSLSVLRKDAVTVLRCAVPERDWADPFDHNVRDMTARLVRDLGIDVVHAHSVQILTASTLEGCLDAGVPVMLSIHDGWWLSEHQFFVDDKGTPFLPQKDYSDMAEAICERMSLQTRVHRRKGLGRLMKQFSHRLAVSDSFADVYRDAGVQNMDVLENGMEIPERSGSRPAAAPGTPLKIGFIGGLSAHKGLRLLETVATTESLPNLEFVLVDHRYEQGYERNGRWGSSKVTYIGKAVQSKVEEVYAQFDILAAPSIWPESYGLVTREARAFGVPVIAGDRGDIGRGIEDGRDGWVIDVSDESALRALLIKLNANPDQGRVEPTLPDVVDIPAAVDKIVELMNAEMRQG